MARIIYPINGKTYTAEDVEIFNSPRTSGIYSVLDFDCSLSGNVLTIGKGLAWIKNGDFTGKCVAFTEPETLTLDSADSTKNRFDVVAIRYDASKTEPELVIIKGATGDIPMLPERKKETYLYELFLYAILRKAGEVSASFENLSDLRDDETFCGIMRDSVTSSVAPLYETLYDDETGMSLVDGHPIPVETDKYVSYVATVKNSDMIVEIPLYAFDDTSFAKKINGKRVISTSGGSETTFLITFECFSENISISDIFWSNNTGNGQAILTKLVGITKQPEGYVKVDSVYNPESHNAQSGEAVKQAIDKALENFEGGGGDIEIPENVETTDNKVTTIDENSTDTQYPSAKAVYDFVDKNQGNGGSTENSAFQTLPIGKNLLNRATNTVGYKLNETGELVSASSYEVTDFISITENTEYCLSKNNGANAYIPLLLYFDVKKEIIGSEKNKATYPITSPSNAKFVRITVEKSATSLQFEQGNKITEYEDFNGANLIDGNKVNFVPKSITPKEVNFFSTKAGGKNLLDRTKSAIGYSLASTGELITSANSETSDFIPVAFGDNLYISGTPDSGYTSVVTGVAFYDENRICVYTNTSTSTIENPVTAPKNAKYVRYTYRKAGTNIQIERGTEATEYEEYIAVPCLDNKYLGFKMTNDLNYSFNPWHGKRLVVDGDSITHDQGRYDYWQFVAAKQHEMYLDITNTSEYANGWKGVGGSRIANENGTSTKSQSLVLRYMDLPDEADLVMIAGGTNDWAHNNVDLGDFDSTDNTTFNGALNELLPALKAKYPLIPVVMMTPIKRGLTHNATNTKGLTLEQFVDAMITKCRQYGVYCLDMYSNCPINPQIPAMKELLFNTNDDTHPNTEGHKVMGKTVAGFIRTLN